MPEISLDQVEFQADQTVNSVIQRYPNARLVFEQLFINLQFEGHDGLDEVAWRRGMASSELIAQLEQVLTEQGGARAIPATSKEDTSRELRQSSARTA